MPGCCAAVGGGPGECILDLVIHLNGLSLPQRDPSAAMADRARLSLVIPRLRWWAIGLEALCAHVCVLQPCPLRVALCLRGSAWLSGGASPSWVRGRAAPGSTGR